jgi:glycosyltransferase involved in cell wall biosynthesis
MRIGIDASPLWSRTKHSGIPRAVREILLQLQRLDRDNDYYLYSKSDIDFALENRRWHKYIHPRIPHLLGSLYLKRNLGDGHGASSLDVFWNTRTFAFPFGLTARAGRVITVHDLVWLLYPETMTTRNRIAQRLFAERAIQQADKVIAVSESTRRGLVERIGVAPEKITVVHHGVADPFTPRDPGQSARLISEKYGTSSDYICTVGTMEPRKNIVTLIEATKILRDRKQLRHQLLIVGGSGWSNSNVHASFDRCGLTERDVRFLGQIPDEDLPALYSGARLFVYPSLYEGFGIPLVEAMACGCPIVASNTSSIPEVVQDAGLFVSPRRPEEFADAILRVGGDAGLRRILVEKGLKRAQSFRWDTAARGVLRAFEEVCEA